MIKIAFCAPWSNPTDLLNFHKQFTNDKKGIFNNFIGIDDMENADYIICLESVTNNLLKYKEKLICLPREPFVINPNKNYEDYDLKYKYTYDNLYHVVTFPQFLNKNFNELENLKYIKGDKNKRLSIISSSKKICDGHCERFEFVKKLDISNLDINIYGFGWNNILNNKYMGALGCYHNHNNNNNNSNNKTKFDGLYSYQYSICIENCKQRNYFTEKFTDAILCWTIPIYHGCPNINEYFPKDCYYEIDINDSDCIKKIDKIVDKEITEKQINALKKARDLILYKYNIWYVIGDILFFKK